MQEIVENTRCLQYLPINEFTLPHLFTLLIDDDVQRYLPRAYFHSPANIDPANNTSWLNIYQVQNVHSPLNFYTVNVHGRALYVDQEKTDTFAHYNTLRYLQNEGN